VFYDGTSAEVGPAYHVAFERLRECFPIMAFEPSTKGFHIERLRRKLQDLRTGKSNEVRPSNLPIYLRKLQSAPALDPA